MAIADWWLKKYPENVVEIGSVTPYYFPGRVAVVVDPYDEHEFVTERISMFDVDISGKNVLSISTIEHIGTSDYADISKHENPIDAIRFILEKSCTCLITFPLGYNKILDTYIMNTILPSDIHRIFYFRGIMYNDWRPTYDRHFIKNIPYGPHSANAVCVLEKIPF